MTRKLSEILEDYEAQLRHITTGQTYSHTTPENSTIAPWTTITPNQYNSRMSLPPPKLLLAYRLGYAHPEALPFEFIEVARKCNGTYAVFIIRGNEVLTLEDDGLFPSDKLMHQLALLMPKRNDE
jgi:hypothetical protein